jgi:hypothetical protein
MPAIHVPLRWPPRGGHAAQPSPRAAPGTASPPTMPCSRRAPSTARPCPARHRLVEAQGSSASQQPAARDAERARAAHRSPARCVPPAHLSMPPRTSCGPILLLLAVLPALPREGQPSATHFSCLTQRMRSSLPCAFVQLLPPTSGSLSHSRPASVRPLRR